MILEEERLSYERARLRQEEERVWKEEQGRKMVENEHHAKSRFLSALQRLEREKEGGGGKEREVRHRRKVV
jgi:hypothetical protein